MRPILSFLVLSLIFISCNKNGGDNKPTAYNGFKVDGAVYTLDTIERDFPATAGALRIRSNDHGGGMVYMRRGGVVWPSADGVYQYAVKHNAADTTEVKVCFEAERDFESYCSMTGGSGVSTTITLTIANGKWSISLPPTQIIENGARTLEISVSEP